MCCCAPHFSVRLRDAVRFHFAHCAGLCCAVLGCAMQLLRYCAHFLSFLIFFPPFFCYHPPTHPRRCAPCKCSKHAPTAPATPYAVAGPWSPPAPPPWLASPVGLWGGTIGGESIGGSRRVKTCSYGREGGGRGGLGICLQLARLLRLLFICALLLLFLSPPPTASKPAAAASQPEASEASSAPKNPRRWRQGRARRLPKLALTRAAGRPRAPTLPGVPGPAEVCCVTRAPTCGRLNRAAWTLRRAALAACQPAVRCSGSPDAEATKHLTRGGQPASAERSCCQASRSFASAARGPSRGLLLQSALRDEACAPGLWSASRCLRAGKLSA